MYVRPKGAAIASDDTSYICMYSPPSVSSCMHACMHDPGGKYTRLKYTSKAGLSNILE